MWIERTSKGLRMCERYVGLDGKTHRACVALVRDTAQARRRAQEELQRIISHKSTLGDVIALNRLVELYLDSRELKPSTRLNYESHHLIRALQRVSCEKHLHPHIFRHTHTALLAEQGMSLDAISRRLGHSNSNITKEIYFHVTEKLKARDEEAMSRVTICP